MEAVQKDRDSKENNKLADLQWRLEQAKGARPIPMKLPAAALLIKVGRNQDEMSEVENAELIRLRTKLEESTKVDATNFEELKSLTTRKREVIEC